MFHKFSACITKFELPVNFNNPFHYRPHPLCLLAADKVKKKIYSHEKWASEVQHGKMFGVLVVRDGSGDLGFLAAFSGLLCGDNVTDYFVPAVYDMMRPDGYFKTEEAEISKINIAVSLLERDDEYKSTCNKLACLRDRMEEELSAMRVMLKENKRLRNEKRKQFSLSAEEEAALTEESRFQKAEFKRTEKKWRLLIADYEGKRAVYEQKIERLKCERKSRSAALQRWLFEHFRMLNAEGECKNLLQIFDEYVSIFPPAGAGECAAPKLLQYAYSHGMQPICMAEFWLGASPVGEIRRDGCFYGACKGKCEPILNFMLKGLQVDELHHGKNLIHPHDIEIVYDDDFLLVVDKPAGILSVPGKTGGVSVQELLNNRMGNGLLYAVHRLDMATSGLLAFAKNSDIQKRMQAMFQVREIDKVYEALLDGVPAEHNGIISLPMSADYVNRPMQKVDDKNGKEALTEYTVQKTLHYKGRECSMVRLFPATGRTHQLRVHCAHERGLNSPIVGDELYGMPDERLMLNAAELRFRHPVTGEELSLRSSYKIDKYADNRN